VTVPVVASVTYGRTHPSGPEKLIIDAPPELKLEVEAAILAQGPPELIAVSICHDPLEVMPAAITVKARPSP